MFYKPAVIETVERVNEDNVSFHLSNPFFTCVKTCRNGLLLNEKIITKYIRK